MRTTVHSILLTFVILMRCISSAVTGADTADATEESVYGARPVVNKQLSMDEAVKIALKESPVVHGAVAEVSAACARLRAAKADRLPMVSANGFASDGNTSSIVASPAVVGPAMTTGIPSGRFSDANVMLMLPVFTGGRLNAMVANAKANRGAAQAEAEGVRQDVAIMTRNAYRAVIARRSVADVADTVLKRNQERLRFDSERLKQEQIPAYTIHRDEAEVAASLQDVTNAKRDIEIALIDLRTVMGVHPSSAIVIEGTLTYENSDGLINSLLAADKASGVKSGVDGLLRVAERNRPELSVAGFNVEGSKASRSAAVGDFNPQVSLFASGDLMKEESMPSRGGATIGVMASIPIFTGGLRSARVDEARAMLQKQEAERQQIAQQVAREVQSALVGLRASEQNISTAESALVAARSESKASEKRYEVGMSTVVDVLDSSAAMTRAENNVIQALYDYNAAKDQLVRSVGRMETLTAND